MGTAYDSEDWFPEDDFQYDPLDMSELEPRWVDFYTDRMIRQAERALETG